MVLSLQNSEGIKGSNSLSSTDLHFTNGKENQTQFSFFTSALFKTSHLKSIIHGGAKLYYCAAFVWIINFLHSLRSERGLCGPFFFLASPYAPNCHITLNDRLGKRRSGCISVQHFAIYPSLQFVATLATFSALVNYSQCFDVFSCQQWCGRTSAVVTLWWKDTNPCREATKRGCCIAFSSAKVSPERGCMCACVCIKGGRGTSSNYHIEITQGHTALLESR